MKFTKIAAGHYATEDGRYAVVVDGYTRGASVTDEGLTGGEWAACFDPKGGLRISHQEGENLDWFPTKRDAVDECKRHAERTA